MSTIAEIESAIEQLPPDGWQAIRRWIIEREPKPVSRSMPPPPDVPMEELQRIHALIEAEFSKVEDGG